MRRRAPRGCRCSSCPRSAQTARRTTSRSRASSAYLNALDYAKDRKQGSSIKQWKDATAPRVAIIDHPDVRRMLLDMKSRVEGLRALAVKLTMHIDHARVI